MIVVAPKCASTGEILLLFIYLFFKKMLNMSRSHFTQNQKKDNLKTLFLAIVANKYRIISYSETVKVIFFYNNTV